MSSSDADVAVRVCSLRAGAATAATVCAGRPSAAFIAEVRAVFETNVFGVIAVTQAMLPLLREAPAGRIVNVSSEVGSLTRQTAPSLLDANGPTGSFSDEDGPLPW